MKRSFKTEVFLTIPLTILVFALTCTSYITQSWVSGEAKISNQSNADLQYNYGLFKGAKVSKSNFLTSVEYDIKSKLHFQVYTHFFVIF